MIDADLELWRAVMAQAFTDLRLSPTLKDKVSRRARRNAIKWFTTRSDDLETVCECANLSPHTVMQEARNLLNGKKVEKSK